MPKSISNKRYRSDDADAEWVPPAVKKARGDYKRPTEVYDVRQDPYVVCCFTPDKTPIDAYTAETIKLEQENKCAGLKGMICPLKGITLPSDVLDIDHRRARTRGGSNDRSNLHALCACCHREKTYQENMMMRGKRDLIQFYRY